MKSVQTSLNQALRQLRAEQARIEKQISALSVALSQLGAKSVNGRRAKSGKVASRTMSAAQKRAVSVRMKAYWAKRRAAKSK